MRPRYNKVRALSANVGSATAGWLLAAPEPACFPIGCEDISVFTVIAGTISKSELSFTTEFGGRPVLQLELPSAGHCANYARVPADQEAIRISVLIRSEFILARRARELPQGVEQGTRPGRSSLYSFL